MADRIKGITVEIAGDTTKLSSALRDVDKTIKDSQKDLKDLNKALKLDPKNVELLKQKQELLNKQIGASEEKLKTLKTAQEQAAREMANGSEEARRNYDLLTREIATCEASLSKLQTEAENTDKALSNKGDVQEKLDVIGTGAEKAGQKIEGIGKAATIASAAVAALGAASIKAFSEVDTGADIVIRKTGATGAAAEALKDIYEEVAGDIAVSFDQAGAAVGEINTRWGYTGDQLKDLSEEFLKFSSISGQDVNSAIVGIDKAMKTFNVDADQTQNVLGLIARTSQNTGIDVSTLESLLQTSGATLQEMGLGLGESVQLMGALEQSGAEASTVISAMQKAATNYAKEGKDMNTELTGLISRLQDSATEAEATEEAFSVFGSRAGLSFINLAKQGKISFDDLGVDFDDYKDVVNKTYEQTLSGTDYMTIAGNNAKIALGKIGEELTTALIPILEDLTEILKKVSDWLGTLSQDEKTTALRLGGIALAAGPVISIIGKAITGIGALIKVVGSLANPLTISLGIITALGFAVGDAVQEMADLEAAEMGWDEEAKNRAKLLDDEITKLEKRVSLNQEAATTITDQKEKAQLLWDELNKIVDENGQVKEGYEKEAEILANEISQELGYQVQLIDGKIEGYQGLAEQMDILIEKKTLEALLDKNREQWLEAKQNEAKTEEEMTYWIGQRSEAERGLKDAQDEYNAALDEYNRKVAEAGGTNPMFEIELGEIEGKLDRAKDTYADVMEQYGNAAATYGENQQILIGYNQMMTAAYSDDAETMKAASDSYLQTMNMTKDDFKQAGYDILNDATATLMQTQSVIDQNAPGVQRSVERMLNPINQYLDDTLAKFTALGQVVAGSNGASVTVTNNNTLLLDGNVVAKSVDKAQGRWTP